MALRLSGRLLVDMDNTMYYSPFAEAARVLVGAECPPTRDLTDWFWYKKYGISEKMWREIVDFVHARLNVYKPFPNVVKVLQKVQHDFEITITSQRETRYKGQVDWWLAEHDIPAHKTAIRPQRKADLFAAGDIVIDDAPHNIEDALKVGAEVVSLRYPYNWHMKRLGAIFVDDWSTIGYYLEEVLPYVDRNHFKGSD